MTERTDKSERILEDSLQKETDLKEEENFKEGENLKEELNEKLLIGLSEMMDNRGEEADGENTNQEDTQKNTQKNTKKNTQKSKQNKPSKSDKINKKTEKTEQTHAKKKKSRKKKSRMKKGMKMFLTVLLALLLVVVALGLCVVGIYWKGKNHMTSASGMIFQIPEEITAISDNNGKTVTYEDRDYRRRAGTTNLLLIGKNSDHTFSTVVVNFDRNSKSLRFMPVPSELLAIDYSSAMNYSDIADYVSEFLCGIPIQGYMVLDMQVVDSLMETESEQVTDDLQMQKLAVFAGEVADNASENWMIPAKIFEEFQESFSTNLQVADLSYVYTLFVECKASPEYEFVGPTDKNMVFQQLLNTFYDEKQE